jgi:hypothetical protein
MDFWDFASAQPVLCALLYVLTLTAVTLVMGGRAVEATKQAVAYADQKARAAEADSAARIAEAQAVTQRLRKETEAIVAEGRASLAAATRTQV